jgi:heme O synthase-like polyprenyltransferase
MSYALEHGSTRPGRWLRAKRLRFTLWIAAAEGLLYLVHVLHWWLAVALAVIAVGFWWYAGRRHRSDLLRQASWIFAVSQLLVLCVPIALSIVTAIAIGVVALLAIGALIFLFTERP